MSAKRKQPNLTDLLAMMICDDERWDLSFEDTRQLSNKAIIARFRKGHDVHHWTYVAVLGGSNHATNMSWMACAKHDKRTRKQDVPAIARMKRRAKKQAREHQDTEPSAKRRGNGGRKIASRPFPSKADKQAWLVKTGRLT